MRFLGLDIRRAGPPARIKQALAGVEDRGAWRRILEPFAGAWQRNMEVSTDSALSYSAVFACATLIASDISKMRLKLTERQGNVWAEVMNPAYSPVLRRPNTYQLRHAFVETWVLSKLSYGNTYILLERDNARRVRGMHVLNPNRVRVLVSPGGEVFYELQSDKLARLGPDGGPVIVPATEMIHDRWNTLFHPLVGLSPIYASGLAAAQGLRIQESSSLFFQNGARPSGLLVAPGEISEETASELKEYWEANFTGANAGKIAVVGDGLKYEQMSMKATDAQLIEQLKWSAETVCSCFHVPTYMVGIGPAPAYNNIEALNQQYYSQCLQVLIEAIEACLDAALSLGESLGTEFDLDGLIRMDTAAKVAAVGEAIKAGWMSPNEARERFGYGPVEGGATPYLQQQNYSLEALAKRDAQEDPFGTAKPPAPDVPALPPPAPAPSEPAQRDIDALRAAFMEELADG